MHQSPILALVGVGVTRIGKVDLCSLSSADLSHAGSFSQESAIWSRAVSEAGYEALWSAGLNRHGRGYSHIVLAMKVVGNMAAQT